MTWQDFSFWEIGLDIIGLFLCGTAVIALVRQKHSQPRPLTTKDREVFNDILTRLTWENMIKSGETGAPFHLGKVKDIHSEGMRPEGFRDDCYHEVERWADSGLNAEEIIRKIDIPKGEVELAMKLKKQASEFHMEKRRGRVAVG